MYLQTYGYEKNSNTITEEERNAFMERLKKACRLKGMSVAYLQAAMGKANAYFRNMGFISPKMAKEVKKFIPELNIEYINTGVGTMFVTPDVVEKEKDNSSNLIPLLPISAQGGSLSAYSESINLYECETINTPIRGIDFAIRVNGDSMEPDYPSGCIVLIKKINEKAFLEWGKVYVLDTCNGVVIKKILPVEGDDGKILCRSLNPAYGDFNVGFPDIFGVYRVVMQMIQK